MLTTNEWEKINDIATSIHGIESNTALRTTFLTKLSAVIDYDLGDFNLGVSSQKGMPKLVDPVVISKFPKHIEDKFTHLYHEKYYLLDYVSWIFAHHQSIVYRESDLIDSKLRKETAFYKEYLSLFDLGHVAGISVISSGRFVGAVTLYKSEAAGDFTEKDLYILNQLLPHLQVKLSRAEEADLKNKTHIYNLLVYNYRLTKKEIIIIGKIKEGYSNQAIADESYTSINTVKNHISNIYEKMQVNSRTQLLQSLVKAQLTQYWE